MNFWHMMTHGSSQIIYLTCYHFNRWACVMCGMYSSRKYSIKRHINNLHDDVGNIVSFNDYIPGRRQGYYFPNPIPTYLLKRAQMAVPKTIRGYERRNV
jgi:hypothetical protein